MTFHNESNQARLLVLVTGAARSGKSEWAEKLAAESGQQVHYVATAQVDLSDLEWQARIAKHQRRRPPDWQTMQVPIDLHRVLTTATAADCLLIDSLGTWLANIIEQDDSTWQQTSQTFLDELRQTSASVILVAEETGWGVVPAYPLGRSFRDRLGQLIRQIGAIADSVYLVTGGYALNLSQIGIRLPTS